jgi:hypothetical protein
MIGIFVIKLLIVIAIGRAFYKAAEKPDAPLFAVFSQGAAPASPWTGAPGSHLFFGAS